MRETVGFIGLGNMGTPIAGNLAAAGYPLRVWNRTASKVEPLLQQGAERASRPAEVVSRGGIAVTMVADDRALEGITSKEFLEALGAGGLHISMSTVAPATARRLAARHAEAGSAYVAAPVFGRPDAATARKLWICASGPAPAVARARPLLDAVGQGIFEFGEEAGAANVVKLCGNFLIAAAMEAMAEAFTLAEKSGVDRVAVARLFAETLFAAPVYKNYGAAIAERRHAPAGFRLALGLKDISLVLGAAAEAGTPMPTASLLRDRFLSAVANGRADLDWSALALGVSQEAGLRV